MSASASVSSPTIHPSIPQLFPDYQIPVSHPEADIYFIDGNGFYIDDIRRGSPHSIKNAILRFCHTTHVKPSDSTRHRLVAVKQDINIENARWIVAQAKHYNRTHMTDKAREFLADKPAFLDLMRDMHAAVEVGELVVPMDLVMVEWELARVFVERRHETIAAMVNQSEQRDALLLELNELTSARLALAECNVAIGRARLLFRAGEPERLSLKQFYRCDFKLWCQDEETSITASISLSMLGNGLEAEGLRLALDLQSDSRQFMPLELNSDLLLRELTSVTYEGETADAIFDAPLSMLMHVAPRTLENLGAEERQWLKSVVVEVNLAEAHDSAIIMMFRLPAAFIQAGGSRKKTVPCWGKIRDKAEIGRESDEHDGQ